ncbi:MAG TPA: SGNH/GDSL hydrolase family protein [Noviherbaspirillum sp.]|jgi:lysophospholipase L1-like esterase|uniref:SGNH/GDSL hydrolase family protein n=1 Tax=Noviherbaspirillum sp. TaxID=1926288 RepID=UPI002DDCE473|nr:SGNH/GDSL hydrolase family protein [Noviherbaspirillum sp.]HEV2612584.1 SGNH/GDSL hydrolase family protein [Noviherbaspirillum sp.]
MHFARRWFPEIVATPLLPLLILQGRRTRRITPRLPEAAGSRDGNAGTQHGTRALTLIAIGESPVAGVGVATQQEAITAQLAEKLAQHMRQAVQWRAIGRNGVTAREAHALLLPEVPQQPIDIVFVAFGVNDTTAFRPVRQWRDDMGRLLAAIDKTCTPGMILLSGVPPMAHFPALPQPLRWVMGLKAGVLDAALRDISNTLPQLQARVLHVPMAIDPADKSVMASDGYHASASGCGVWAGLIAEAYIRDVNSRSQHIGEA